MKNEKLFVITALVVLVIDQLTKFLVRHFSVDLRVCDFFSVTYTKNTGALFGLFQGNALAFAFLGLIAAGLLLYFYKEVGDKKLPQIFYGIVLGGVFGNIIDRFLPTAK